MRIPLHYSVWDILQDICPWRKAWAVCETQRSECYHRHTAWRRYQTARIRKAILQWKKRLALSSRGKGEWRTYSAHFLLIIWLVIRPTVTFWHSLRTRGNANDAPLAKIALWRVKLFCLYRG